MNFNQLDKTYKVLENKVKEQFQLYLIEDSHGFYMMKCSSDEDITLKHFFHSYSIEKFDSIQKAKKRFDELFQILP